MTHASLFSGIGGFDLAAEWAGMENIFQVEYDPFCTKVLKKNFPNVKRYGDIKQFDGTPYRGTIDVLSGGFPCQPFSSAGSRKGDQDDRYLWPEMLRVIREVQPQWVVGENVAGLITWNNGMVLEQVCSDLEAADYEVQPLVIPACAVDAPHRRDRIWFVAHRNKLENRRLYGRRKNKEASSITARNSKTTPNSLGSRLKRLQGIQTGIELPGRRAPLDRGWWESEPAMGRVVHGLPNRVDRTKALGNAIVPQVAYEIFKSLT